MNFESNENDFAVEDSSFELKKTSTEKSFKNGSI